MSFAPPISPRIGKWTGMSTPPNWWAPSFHHMAAGQAIAAVHAVRLGGAGLLPAMGAVDHFGSDPAVNHPIPRIDFEDLGFQVFVGEADVIAQQLPHRLAGERQFLDLLLGVVLAG